MSPLYWTTGKGGTYHYRRAFVYAKTAVFYQEPPFYYPLLFKEGIKQVL